MRVTDHPTFRRFWYPVLPGDQVTGDAPVPFTLLGQPIVLWRGTDGTPAAAIDRCCHRTAKLSKGWVSDGEIVCGYHGWQYAPDGRCTKVPQAKDQSRAPKFRIAAYQAEERYGYVWVCLDAAPLAGIPEIAEAENDGFRVIQEFYEVWNCAGLRVMENSFDNAHFSFVHRASFGDQGHPEPARLTVDTFDGGFVMRSDVPVKNPEIQKKVLRMAETETVRHMTATWFLPFARKLHIRYPNGLIHIIVTVATPIDDARSQICQFVVRNDTEADARAADIIAFDRQVTGEDKEILESTEYDVPLDQNSGLEFHMPSDKPGLLMRRQLAALLAREEASAAAE